MPATTFRRFLADRRGAMMILAGLMMPVFVGGLGLGGEAGYWYFNQRKLQNAADVAAYAGAAQLRAEASAEEIAAAALSAALDTQYDTSIGTITTNSPPATGAFAGDPSAVEVVVQENVPRMFSAIFADGDVPMSGRAVAQLVAGATACILALDPDASGAVTFTGSSSAVLDGCNVHANSLAPDAVTVTGSGEVETPCVSAVGGVSESDGLTMTSCVSAIEHAYVIEDPYASLPTPPTALPCEPQNDFGGPPGATYTIDGGRYCGGLAIRRTVTMNSGIYVIDGGDFDVNSTAVVSGAEVMIYLTNGARLQFNGSAELQLSAPLPGAAPPLDDYVGVLFFANPLDPFSTHILNGNADSLFNGAIYAPGGKVRIAGSSSVGGGCTQVVALQIDITGDAGLGTDCTGTGIDEIEADQLVTLVE